MSKLCALHYTSSSTWTCPAGVTEVFVVAQGGGAGGTGGLDAVASTVIPGGGGTIPYGVTLSVVPNTTYVISIGSGGSGGTSQSSFTINGGDGGDTTFGSLYTFFGAPADQEGFAPKLCISAIAPSAPSNYDYYSGYVLQDRSRSKNGSGGSGYASAGGPGYTGSLGGEGGDPSPTVAGGDGGDGTGIGAGGGAGGTGNGTGGAGGDGTGGQMWITWVE